MDGYKLLLGCFLLALVLGVVGRLLYMTGLSDGRQQVWLTQYELKRRSVADNIWVGIAYEEDGRQRLHQLRYRPVDEIGVFVLGEQLHEYDVKFRSPQLRALVWTAVLTIRQPLDLTLHGEFDAGRVCFTVQHFELARRF
jgi:hypothetical protein